MLAGNVAQELVVMGGPGRWREDTTEENGWRLRIHGAVDVGDLT